MINVIMSAFNAESTIEQAVDSLLEQTEPPERIIIVDDASKDGTARLLKRYASDQVIILYNSKNEHVARSLNRALQHLTDDCQFVARMDADDVCEPDRFRQQVDFLKANELVDFVGCFATEFSDLGESVKSFPERMERILGALLFRSPFCHPTVMFRSTVVSEDFYNPNFVGCEDHALWVRLLLEGDAVGANLNVPLLRYRRHQAQVTSSHLSPSVARSLYSYILSSMNIQLEDDALDLLVLFLEGDFDRINSRSTELMVCLRDLYRQVDHEVGDDSFERELFMKWLRYCRSYKSRDGLKLYLKLSAHFEEKRANSGAIKTLLHDMGIPGRRLNESCFFDLVGALVCPVLFCKITLRRCFQ